MVYSIVYVSNAVHPANASDELLRANLLQLQNAAEKKNREHGIRGLLLCGPGYYVQWLEGERVAVDALLETIEADDRHDQLQVLYRGEAVQMLDSWSMTLLAPSAAPGADAKALASLRGGELPPAAPGGVPAAIVRRLVKPVPGAEGQRVGLIGQNGVWSGALAAYLANKWAVPLQRARIVGSQGLDRQALIEYLWRDDPEFGPLSLVHYSGDLLATPWMHGYVAPMATAVLFFSGSSEESLLDFAERALDYLGPANDKTRLLCLFGRSAARYMPTVERWLLGQGRAIRAEAIALADSTAAWHAVAQGLHKRATPAAIVPSAASVTPVVPAAPLPAAKTASPGKQVNGSATPPTHPEPTAWDLTPAGHAWLDLLLRADGVAAAGLAPVQPGSRGVLRVKDPTAEEAHLSEFQVWSKALPSLHLPETDREAAQIIVRSNFRLTLLHDLREAQQPALLYVATTPGFVNEGWLRAELQSALSEMPHAITLSAPAAAVNPAHH